MSQHTNRISGQTFSPDMIMNLKTHAMLFDKNLCFNEGWLLITLSGPILLQTPMDNNVTLNIYGTVILVAEKRTKIVIYSSKSYLSYQEELFTLYCDRYK